MVEAVDDEHPDAGLVCTSVYQSTSLLFLVRADPAQLALRLPSLSPGKNGRIAADSHRRRKRVRVAILSVSNIRISEVTTRRERNAFIRFPWKVYAGDPAWVPPLLIERKAFLDRKRHPFYRHGDAALFLARKNGEIVGRIMASDDPNYNSLHGANAGCFG